jgi:hypothetical protein
MSAASADTPLQALLRAHAQEREARAAALTRAAADALTRADEVENNFRAALGKELNASVANQNHLELAVRQLRSQVQALSHQCALYGRDYAALAAAADRAGAVPFLEATGATLARAGAALEAAAAKIEALQGE